MPGWPELIPGGVDWRAAVVIGGAVAMSSTALVSKMLAESRELETEHGKRVFGILLFQDLALIPLLILTPALERRRRPVAARISAGRC